MNPNPYKEKTIMNKTNTGANSASNTTTKNKKEINAMITNTNTTANQETNMPKTIHTSANTTNPVYQDMPHIALMKKMYPFCKTAKVGNLLYPVFPSDTLMEFITDDGNFVAAVREVKSHASNPSGSEHGVVKKVCDMIINYPSFRQIIRQDLLKGDYYPEGIVFDPVFHEKNMTLPRGFKYTMNKIVQTMIKNTVKDSGIATSMMPFGWSETNKPSINTMLSAIDYMRRAKGHKCWISFKLKPILDNIPHDHLVQKIQIMFQEKRVADVICALMGLNVPSADNHKGTKNAGISEDSPLANMLAYDLYMGEFDQEVARLGLDYVRFNDEIVIFCDTNTQGEQVKNTLFDFAQNTMGCPVDRRHTKIKDIAHLAFFGMNLQDGRWCIQYKVKKAVANSFIILLMAYGRFQEDHYLWSAYRKLTKFISRYEDVYALENEIKRLKEWRDGHITSIVAFVERVKLGLEKLPE